MYSDKPDWSLFGYLGDALGNAQHLPQKDWTEEIATVWFATIVGLLWSPFSLLIFIIKHQFEVSLKTWIYFALAWLGIFILFIVILAEQ